MDKRLLNLLGRKDALWTDIAQYKPQLEAVLKRGFGDESDVVAVKRAIALILAELAYRQAEITIANSRDES